MGGRERGTVRLNLERGATVAEFRKFLDDLELAYVAIYDLPTIGDAGYFDRPHLSRREYRLSRYDYLYGNMDGIRPRDIYPPDQLEISKISIQSPGWIELLASWSPLQQIREYLKDRHERKKDKLWRWESERMREMAELELLRIQAERERTGAIRDFYGLLEEMDVSSEERQKILWQRLGAPLSRLAHHQDSGLLGSQNDNIDGQRG
jgi:hypothetical protein